MDDLITFEIVLYDNYIILYRRRSRKKYFYRNSNHIFFHWKTIFMFSSFQRAQFRKQIYYNEKIKTQTEKKRLKRRNQSKKTRRRD